MSQILALEWNAREIRIALGARRGGRTIIEDAFAVRLDDSAASENRWKSIGQRIAKELDDRGIGRPPALVAVGRTSIELRQVQLPPAPDQDLPDMVRFQAAREFNEFDDKWLLDFVPIDQGGGGPRTVLATAIAPAVIEQIEKVCEAAGLKMKRLLLRPCAVAALMPHGGKDTAEPQLLIDLLADEAELTAVLGGRAVFLRTMRLAAESPPTAALLSEIRLTLAAVQNQLAGNRIAAVLLCGEGPLQAELATAIQNDLCLRSEMRDPFAGWQLGPNLRDAIPEPRGRFAAVLGMLLGELDETGHAVDFLHPRRRLEPPSRRKQWIVAAVAGAVLPIAYLSYARFDNYHWSNAVKELQASVQSLDRSLASSKAIRATVSEVEKWSGGEGNWLDPLYAVSQGLPPAEDAVLSQFTGDIPRQGGALLDVKGWARNAEVIAKMEEKLRSRTEQVVTKNSKEDGSMANYSWRFEATIIRSRSAKP